MAKREEEDMAMKEEEPLAEEEAMEEEEVEVAGDGDEVTTIPKAIVMRKEPTPCRGVKDSTMTLISVT
jgi:hypothetical protein